MTENEALEIINQNLYQGNLTLALDITRKTISEIQQYRSIGTVEEINQIKRDLDLQISHSNKIAEILKSTRNILSKREELLKSYCSIGTVSECREAMEKQIPKEPVDDTAFGSCPNCHSEFNSELVNEYDMKYCLHCGQALE